MSTALSETVPVSARVIHWAGALLGTGLVLLFAAFIVGEGPPPVSIGSAALAVMLCGFLLAWWDDLLGGVMSLIGIGCFYLGNLAESGGLPGGPIFPLCFVPGVLHVTAWLLRRRGQARLAG